MAAERITILGKTFEKTIPEAEIQEAVKNVASRIKEHDIFLVQAEESQGRGSLMGSDLAAVAAA